MLTWSTGKPLFPDDSAKLPEYSWLFEDANLESNLSNLKLAYLALIGVVSLFPAMTRPLGLRVRHRQPQVQRVSTGVVLDTEANGLTLLAALRRSRGPSLS